MMGQFRACALLASCLCVGACVLRGQPTLRGCGPGGVGAGHAALSALPSTMPGVTIDTAYWLTDAERVDLGVQTSLILATRIKTTRAVPLDSLAILYEMQAPGSDRVQLIADIDLFPPIYTPRLSLIDKYDFRNQLIAAAGSNVGIEYNITLESGLVTSLSLRPACPRSVRAVRRAELVRFFVPGALAPSRLAALAQAQHGMDGMTIAVFDTLVATGNQDRMILGFALNTGDTTLRGVTRAFAVDNVRPRYGDNGQSAGTTVTRDTLEYLLGDIAPGKLVLFAGVGTEGFEQVVGRATYPAAIITGRRIATVGSQNRVSLTRTRAPDSLDVVPASQ